MKSTVKLNSCALLTRDSCSATWTAFYSLLLPTRFMKSTVIHYSCALLTRDSCSATWTDSYSLLLPTRYKKSTVKLSSGVNERFQFCYMGSFLLFSSANKVCLQYRFVKKIFFSLAISGVKATLKDFYFPLYLFPEAQFIKNLLQKKINLFQ